MNSLNEIFGTRESDHFSDLSAEVIGKSADDLIPTHEEVNFGTIFDLDMSQSQRSRWSCHEVRNVGQGTCQDIVPIDEALLKPHDPFFSYSIQQTNSLDQDVNIYSCIGIADEQDYNPYLYMTSWQNLPDIVAPYWPQSLLKEPQRGLRITLVLDLDGKSIIYTLVPNSVLHIHTHTLTDTNMPPHTICICYVLPINRFYRPLSIV